MCVLVSFEGERLPQSARNSLVSLCNSGMTSSSSRELGIPGAKDSRGLSMLTEAGFLYWNVLLQFCDDSNCRAVSI